MATATESQAEHASTGPQVGVAIFFGAVLALVGILGPVLAGANDNLIIFGRNYLHDAVHLGSGVAGLAAGYYAGGKFAKQYNVTLGVVYALVTVLGFVATGLLADLINLNAADNFLHLALALVFLAVGFGLGES